VRFLYERARFAVLISRAHETILLGVDDLAVLEQLLTDILEMYPHGPRRVRMLAWLDAVAAEAGYPRWRNLH
jgi:hypothetical protein